MRTIFPAVVFVAFLSSSPALPAQKDTQQDADEIDLKPSPILPAVVDTPALRLARQVQDGFADLAEHVWPSVVTVRAYRRIPAEVEGEATAALDAPGAPAGGWVAAGPGATYPGFVECAALTGWVVGEDGEVLTCNHALTTEDGGTPDLIDFETHDFQRVIAERVGVEPTVNLAILQGMVWPNGHPRRLPALQWGNSDRLRPGHWLLCFGDPAGPERFLTVGTFVARPSRDCYQDLLSAFYMQAGLVAHPQAYGGPMIDLTGRVVGVLAPSQPAPGKWRASARQGVEFGLPSKIVQGLHEAIRSARSFRSPWLGYAVMSRPEVARTRGMEAYRAMAKPRNGILIENVYDPGPAWAAGIRPGDWLVTFDTTRIFTPVDFQKQLYLRGIGSKVRVEICRDGASRWHELVVEQRPDGATPR